MFRDLEKNFVSQFTIDTINITKKQFVTSRKQIDTQLNSPLLKNTHVILMGDMNIDLSKLSVNDAIEIYYNTLLCHNLESHINSPTRIQYNKKY